MIAHKCFRQQVVDRITLDICTISRQRLVFNVQCAILCSVRRDHRCYSAGRLKQTDCPSFVAPSISHIDIYVPLRRYTSHVIWVQPIVVLLPSLPPAAYVSEHRCVACFLVVVVADLVCSESSAINWRNSIMGRAV